MFRGIEKPEVLDLQNAFLCVDCESVSNTRSDECPTCGGHSLLSLARSLGGTLAAYKANRNHGEAVVMFNVEIAIGMRQLDASDLNATIDGITSLISPRLGHGRASLHVNVEPIEVDHAKEPKAA